MANLRLENLHMTFNNLGFELDERQIRMIEGNYKIMNISASDWSISNGLLVI